MVRLPVLTTLAALATLATSCLPSEQLWRNRAVAPDIVGTWHGAGSGTNPEAWVLEIGKLGEATWTIGGETYHVNYTYKSKGESAHLLFDLHDFDRGPLEGKVLFGIIEFTGPDTLRWSAEPGPADRAEEIRPKKFVAGESRKMIREH